MLVKNNNNKERRNSQPISLMFLNFDMNEV